MSFTPQQELAINAPGNTLVVAGAGAGKTRTLVEKCIRLVIGPRRVSIRQLLVVTFTEAAAAEVRERIRQRLEAELHQDPANSWVQEQVALLDHAHISTLHGFCFSLVREHFHELALDPAVSILPNEQGTILCAEQLEALLQEHFRGQHSFSHEVQELIRERFDGWDKPLREFILRLHTFTQTRPDPTGWFQAQRQLLENPKATAWERWYREALAEWCQWWVPYLESLPAENENARHCSSLLREACQTNPTLAPAQILAREAKECWPKGKMTAHRAPFKKLFEEARFFASLQPNPAGPDPLEQDWEWVRPLLLALLRLAEQFGQKYADAKRERSALDFHDLEQFALKLLWDGVNEAPTTIARDCQARFQAIFVDEYQDINAAQDMILTALARPGAEGNRFLVGDIKQSIYRFRQADPGIFRRYLADGGSTGWARASLSENFRSHEGVLDFVNPLFAAIMQDGLGGVAYDDEAALRFGNRAGRPDVTTASDPEPAVEVHILSDDAVVEGGDDDEGDHGDAELETTEKEARLIAQRLSELKEHLRIPDEKNGGTRPLCWSDMVVLLRGVKNRAETFAKAFHEFGVPLETKRNAFYSTQEVLDLVSILHILDNPLQDIPLLGVLRSPLGGLGVNDLATIRQGNKATPFWRALTQFHEGKKQGDTWRKVDIFLDQYHRWRRGSRSLSLCHRLEMILAETGYGEWLLAQERGRQRYANVQQLLRIARDFDQMRGENLYLFLRHIEELQEATGDIEPAAVGESDAVRMMSVHQSKGLEFPVVAVAGLGSKFNLQDTSQALLLDEQYGICAHVKPPGIGQRYASLTHWLAARHGKRESLGEELRVLYVALTRARNRLLLFGSARPKRIASWSEGHSPAPSGLPWPHILIRACNWLDWIGPQLAGHDALFPNVPEGTAGCWRWRIHTVVPAPKQTAPSAAATQLAPDDPAVTALRARLIWEYPHAASTLIAAKTTVTALRKRGEALDEDEEASRAIIRLPRDGNGESGLTRGTAYHAFLERMELTPTITTQHLEQQGAEMVASGALPEDQLELIDFEAVAGFWNSELGREFRQNGEEIRRELPFTARLDRANLKRFRLEHLLALPEGEFVVVQGIADLVLLRPREIWLLDFKTDRVRGRELRQAVDTYRPQLTVYSLALEAIYRRPVTRTFLHFFHADRTEEVERTLL